MKALIETWRRATLAREALREHRVCMRDVYAVAGELLRVAPDTPSEFAVGLAPIPRSFYQLRKNLFSVLFMSVYHMLGIPEDRRLLYGRINHLFRAWVTSADNLLDDEQKTVVPLAMQAGSRVMREVITVMSADRILSVILDDAQRSGVINAGQARDLLFRSLQVLLPSAGQEASEEQGVTERPTPADVLSTIHRYKTGLLFQIPLMAPETVEAAALRPDLRRAGEALLQFGVGCQLLDDVRDVGRDLREQRHNYVLSLLYHEHPQTFAALIASQPRDRLYQHLPDAAIPTARLGLSYMKDGLHKLDGLGLGIEPAGADAIAAAMFRLLDLEDLEYV